MKTSSIVEEALGGEIFSIARILSLFESSRDEDRAACVSIENQIEDLSLERGVIIGLTGAPGSGKSTLIQHLIDTVLQTNSKLRIAIVAVDPSSPISGGALLGDRTRVNFGDNARTYFRSQASDLDLGGIGRNTYRVCRILRRLFDIVLVESVGVGQSEIEIARLSDATLLALQPFSGDQIQFMKSGIMEVPQAFVITKCDAEDLAKKSLYQLQASLDFMHRAVAPPGVHARTSSPAIFQTSSLRKSGFAELAAFMLSIAPLDFAADLAREEYFLQKEIRYYYGEFGVRAMAALAVKENQNFEIRRKELLAALGARFNHDGAS